MMTVFLLILTRAVETVLLAKLVTELVLECRMRILFLDNYDSAKKISSRLALSVLNYRFTVLYLKSFTLLQKIYIYFNFFSLWKKHFT